VEAALKLLEDKTKLHRLIDGLWTSGSACQRAGKPEESATELPGFPLFCMSLGLTPGLLTAIIDVPTPKDKS